MIIKKQLREIEEVEMFDVDMESLHEEGDTFKDFCDKVDSEIMNKEIIYYSNAMEYLSREDSSLSESLEVACEYGYTTGQLSSELLATLLYRRKLSQKWYEIEGQVERLFNK